jgi:DNA-binding transcriptional MocR family regulator
MREMAKCSRLRAITQAAIRQRLAAEVLGPLKRIAHPASYFIWIPLEQEVGADAMALMRERISVTTALPFSTSAHVPHAIRLAIGSVELTTLRRSLETVVRVVAGQTY